MKNKILATILIAMLCFLSIGAAAKENTSDTKQGTAATEKTAISSAAIDGEATIEQTEDKDTGEDEAVEEQTEDKDTGEDEAVEGQTEDKDTDEDEAVEDQTKDNATDEDKTIEEGKDSTDQTTDENKTDETKVDKTNNGKSKVAKDQLEAKKAERAAARLQAKDYIKDLRTLFKDADNATRKDILAQIAEAKKELKDNSIGVFVKGLVVDFNKYDNVTPVIKDNRTLVPVRAIVESLGANVLWEADTNKITVTKGDTTIVMQLDNKTATVNGKEVQLDVPPTTVNDRTLVPIRFITEALNLNVQWDDNSQTVVVDE